MPVDLDKISSHVKALEGNLEPGGKDRVAVIDRVALKKDWAPSGDASYWVDILWNPLTGHMQVWRQWRFNQSGTWIEGNNYAGRASKNADAINSIFVEAVQRQLTEKDYVVVERQKGHNSPAVNIDFDGPVRVAKAPTLEEIEESKPAILKRKKGSHDWW